MKKLHISMDDLQPPLQQGPVLSWTQKRVRQEWDISLVVDSSGSMAATDFPPCRLEAAQKAARLFTSRKIVKGDRDRVGLIMFGGSAQVVHPLTDNLAAIDKAICGIPGVTHTGTAIGTALAAAAHMVSGEPNGRCRAIILLSDGENYGGPDPRAVAHSLADVRVFTIGIGSEKGQDIHLPGLGAVRVRLDEKLLREIAKITGGRYYHAPQASDLLDIFAELAEH